MNKTIIAVYGRQGEGKSATLKKACQILINNYQAQVEAKYLPVDYTGDILLTMRMGTIKIGIESQGDPNSRMFWAKSIENLAVVEKCDIILCASRTSGGTVSEIDRVAAANNYEVIWLSSIGGRLNHDTLNLLGAENIIRIIEGLTLGRL